LVHEIVPRLSVQAHWIDAAVFNRSAFDLRGGDGAPATASMCRDLIVLSKRASYVSLESR